MISKSSYTKDKVTHNFGLEMAGKHSIKFRIERPSNLASDLQPEESKRVETIQHISDLYIVTSVCSRTCERGLSSGVLPLWVVMSSSWISQAFH